MGPFPTPAAWQAALEARHGQALQAKFSAATVAICGLGGLGSHLALSLARAGVGKLILLDFDRVDLTNLHRQQYKASQIGQPKALALADNLREANPYLALEPHVVRVTEDNLAPLLAEATLVCEAFDQAAGQGHAGQRRAGALPGEVPGGRLGHGGAGLGQRHHHPPGEPPVLPLRGWGERRRPTAWAWWPPGWQCAQGTRPTWSCAF